jgi:hypothetical protein
MTSDRDDWPFEARWTVHRRAGAKRIAIKHPQWHKPLYLTTPDAEDLMKQIAEALGVEPPEVPMRTPCPAVCPDMEQYSCQAWAEEHIFGTHYHTTDTGVKITWSTEGA